MLSIVQATSISLASIDMEGRRRDLHADEVASMAESLRHHGQLTPIQVVETQPYGFKLVAGGRRVLGARKLGWNSIRAEIVVAEEEDDIEIGELIENLHRSELTVMERANWTARLVELMNKHRQSSQHETTTKARQGGEQPTDVGISAAARELGTNKMAIARDVQVATIAPAAQEAARAAGLDDNQTALLEVSKAGREAPEPEKAARQVAVVAAITARKEDAAEKRRAAQATKTQHEQGPDKFKAAADRAKRDGENVAVLVQLGGEVDDLVEKMDRFLYQFEQATKLIQDRVVKDNREKLNRVLWHLGLICPQITAK